MASNSEDQARFGKRANQPARPAVRTASEALRPSPGTPPPKRSRHSRNRFVVFLNFVLSCIVLLVVGVGIVFYLGKREFEGPGPSKADEVILIEPNTGVREIADTLESRGLVSDARIFLLGVRAYGNDGSLKAGEYRVEAGASMRDIMDLLKSGKSILYSLTVPEGTTVAQAFERIAKTQELAGEMPPEMPPEGSLAADTIRFTRGTERKEIIAKLKAEQEKLVQEIWSNRQKDLPLDSPEEFVTLASIVEKETGVAAERPMVAAVFINRLKKGMRLQSDPTIIYGLFGGEGKPPDRPIFQSDLEKQTAYNTYLIDGLPPTPIANPGRAALEAVANPADTDALYFVADGTGGHVFSSTLDEHNQNVARWRELKNKQEEATAAEAAKPEADKKPAAKD